MLKHQMKTQMRRLQELTDHAKRNGHKVELLHDQGRVTFTYGAIVKKIYFSKINMFRSALCRIDECCEILEGIAFKPAPSAQTK